jgi:hypothetical protein
MFYRWKTKYSSLEVDQGYRKFCASFEAFLFVNLHPGLEKGQWMPSDLSLR